MTESIGMLSKNAQIIQDILLKQGLTLKVVELSARTRTAQEAAEAIGCHVAQIIKSLIFRTAVTHRPILLLVSGINRVNEKNLMQYLSEKIVRADADFVREVTVFSIGGIPPIGHKKSIETFIDQDLLSYPELWAAAGTPHAVFCIPSDNLMALTNGTVIPVI